MIISNSGYNKFTACAYMFKLHYKDRIRTTLTTSALVFGSAMDEALNYLLEGGTDAYAEFEKSFAGTQTNVRVMFDKKDYDPLLITDEEKNTLLEACQDVGYPGGNVDMLMEDLFKIQGRNGVFFEEMSDNQKLCLSLCCSFSLSKKAELMIEAYIEEILPKLSDISGVQKLTTDGEKVRGYLDFKAELNGFRVLDNKTAKNKYTQANIDSSTQLKLYAHLEGIYEVGYIVINKDIRHYKKRPPKVDIQVMLFDVDPVEAKFVHDTISEVHDIAQGDVFPKNLNSCHKFFGRKCDYFNYCKNGDMTNLEVKDG